MEITLKELQCLLIEGKISTEKFSEIMIDNFGEKNFMESMQHAMEKSYDKDLLNKKLSSSIEKTFGL